MQPNGVRPLYTPYKEQNTSNDGHLLATATFRLFQCMSCEKASKHSPVVMVLRMMEGDED